MPLPRWLGRFNRDVTNRMTRSFAGRLPGFAIVVHTGRRSGHRHRTPVNMFRSRDADAYVIALTYGRDGDWVRNVMAAGGCDVETRGGARHLEDPRIVTDANATLVPVPIRPILKAAGVTEFMELRVTRRPAP